MLNKKTIRTKEAHLKFYIFLVTLCGLVFVRVHNLINSVYTINRYTINSICSCSLSLMLTKRAIYIMARLFLQIKSWIYHNLYFNLKKLFVLLFVHFHSGNPRKKLYRAYFLLVQLNLIKMLVFYCLLYHRH